MQPGCMHAAQKPTKANPDAAWPLQHENKCFLHFLLQMVSFMPVLPAETQEHILCALLGLQLVMGSIMEPSAADHNQHVCPCTNSRAITSCGTTLSNRRDAGADVPGKGRQGPSAACKAGSACLRAAALS